MTPQPAQQPDAGHHAAAPPSLSSDAGTVLSAALSAVLAPAAGEPDPHVAVAFTLGWQMEELYRPQTRRLPSKGAPVPGDLPSVDMFDEKELDLLGVAEMRAGLFKLRHVVHDAGLRLPSTHRLARGLGVADIDDVVAADDPDDGAAATAPAPDPQGVPKAGDGGSAAARAAEAAQLLVKLAATVAKVAQEVAQEVAQDALGGDGGHVASPESRHETRRTTVLEFHLQVLTTLMAAHARLGKAYWLGCALAETCLAPTDMASLHEEFARQRVETMRAALDDLRSAFCAHAGATVAASLEQWSAWLCAPHPDVAPEAVIVRLRDQGRLWRTLLTGDKGATDMLRSQDYVAASGEMMRKVRALAWAFLRDHILLVVLVVLLFVGGILLMVLPQTSGTTVAGLSAVLTAVGLTWKGIGGSLGSEMAKLERPLWGASLDDCITPRITILPAAVPGADKTSLFRDRERPTAHPPPQPQPPPDASRPAAAVAPRPAAAVAPPQEPAPASPAGTEQAAATEQTAVTEQLSTRPLPAGDRAAAKPGSGAGDRAAAKPGSGAGDRAAAKPGSGAGELSAAEPPAGESPGTPD